MSAAAAARALNDGATKAVGGHHGERADDEEGKAGELVGEHVWLAEGGWVGLAWFGWVSCGWMGKEDKMLGRQEGGICTLSRGDGSRLRARERCLLATANSEAAGRPVVVGW